MRFVSRIKSDPSETGFDIEYNLFNINPRFLILLYKSNYISFGKKEISLRKFLYII